jgi:hypothetical protein
MTYKHIVINSKETADELTKLISTDKVLVLYTLKNCPNSALFKQVWETLLKEDKFHTAEVEADDRDKYLDNSESKMDPSNPHFVLVFPTITLFNKGGAFYYLSADRTAKDINEFIDASSKLGTSTIVPIKLTKNANTNVRKVNATNVRKVNATNVRKVNATRNVKAVKNVNTANTAKNTVNTAKNTVNTAKNTVNTVKKPVNTVKNTVNTAKNTVNTKNINSEEVPKKVTPKKETTKKVTPKKETKKVTPKKETKKVAPKKETKTVAPKKETKKVTPKKATKTATAKK